MKFDLLFGGLAGAAVGGVSYFVLSGYSGGADEGFGGIILILFAAATLACLLLAAYACLPENEEATATKQ